MRLRICTLLVFVLLPFTGFSADRDSTTAVSSRWEFLGAPYVTVDPDFGVVVGLGLGLQKQLYTSMLIHGAVSSKRQSGITFKGEAGTPGTTYVFAFREWLNPAGIYPDAGALPDPIAEALLQRMEVKLSALHKQTSTFEIGPDVWFEFDQGLEPETPDGAALDVNSLPRYRSGSIAMVGLRARWRTTSATRPLDGVILDGALRAGRADGHEYSTPRFTIAANLWAAAVKPLTDRLRLYGRLRMDMQSEAPTSVRYSVGGESTLRGQPFNRDYGRRLIAARIQAPCRVASGVTLFTDVAQFFLPFFPTWNLDLELAPFADFGAVADPDYGGWKRTRQGYGLSFRMVLPPELVFFFDLGFTPGGAGLFYFGAGETL
ncbi:MAG: hypothetical protein V2A56_01175 [bacterium]